MIIEQLNKTIILIKDWQLQYMLVSTLCMSTVIFALIQLITALSKLT